MKYDFEQNEIKEVNDSVNVEETNSIINSNQNIDEKDNNLISYLRDFNVQSSKSQKQKFN